jgi:hypothetical protein
MKQEKQEQKHDTCEIRIQLYFIAKDKTKQSFERKTYPKLVLNILKVIKISTSIYTH